MDHYRKILNLGCGKGQNIPQILGRGEIVCIDIDCEAIKEAQKKYPRCKFVCARAENLNYQSSFFDEIYCFDILEHVDDLDAVMKKIGVILKDDGFLYVEVPYDKSEDMLLRVNPLYFQQIGHRRIFRCSQLESIFNAYGFKIIRKKKTRGIVNVYLWLLFTLGIGLDDQMSSVRGKSRLIERVLFATTVWFDKNLFNTFLRWIPVWVITLPVGSLISAVFPKTIELTLRKR